MDLFRRKQVVTKKQPKQVVAEKQTYTFNVSVYRDGDFVVVGTVDDQWIERYQGVTLSALNVRVVGKTPDEKLDITMNITVYVIDTIDNAPITQDEERAIAVGQWVTGDNGARIIAEIRP